MVISNDELLTLIESQLEVWPLASENFHSLSKILSKKASIGDYRIRLQCNPARIRSTAAAVDRKTVSERPCFLCSQNRPEQQLSAEIIPGWELLVNPYPIFPMHFTLASTAHRRQSQMPLEMAQMAEMMPGLAVFFNGEKAGASAPDHLHCQAVLNQELPIISLAEACHTDSSRPVVSSDSFGLNLPFIFISVIITPDIFGMKTLSMIPEITGADSDGRPDHGLKNVIMWIDDSGLLRAVIIPRRAHRPSCYYETGDKHRMVSPGTIDMAGVLILPVMEDFNTISDREISRIYEETAYKDSLPDCITPYLS